MAGDLPFEEILVINGPTDDGATREVGPPQAPAPPVSEYGDAPVLQRYGDRVEIRLGSTDGGGAVVPDISPEVLATLTETELLGVEALQLRASDAYVAAKQNRPRDGERWDMPGCDGAPRPLLQIGRSRTGLRPRRRREPSWPVPAPS